MTNLSDTQRVLLSTAAQRDSGSLLPLPTSLKPGGGTAKAITALIKHGLAAERETNDLAAARRSGDDMANGVFITPAGGAAIGIDLADQAAAGAAEADKKAANITAAQDAPRASRASSKTAAVIALLTRPDGATLPDLIAETGWLPHTTRAALTGLRKKGHTITKGKRDGTTCYRIVEAA
ncbi:MAG: DUF3489 domain-containing protein [Sphingomonas phyllosphaerae]|uniref:DUF3489 domain-containing protein n=1 Tax=Sphingomonas phyllosphaerae TaxID=257003 RepID=UPI002FF93EFE